MNGQDMGPRRLACGIVVVPDRWYDDRVLLAATYYNEETKKREDISLIFKTDAARKLLVAAAEVERRGRE